MCIYKYYVGVLFGRLDDKRKGMRYSTTESTLDLYIYIHIHVYIEG